MSKIELLSGTPLDAEMHSVLTEPALAFIAELAERFAPRVAELLAAREQRQAHIDAGELPDFLPGTAAVRNPGAACSGETPTASSIASASSALATL